MIENRCNMVTCYLLGAGLLARGEMLSPQKLVRLEGVPVSLRVDSMDSTRTIL